MYVVYLQIFLPFLLNKTTSDLSQSILMCFLSFEYVIDSLSSKRISKNEKKFSLNFQEKISSLTTAVRNAFRTMLFPIATNVVPLVTAMSTVKTKLVTCSLYNAHPVQKKWRTVVRNLVKKWQPCPSKHKKNCAKEKATATRFLKKEGRTPCRTKNKKQNRTPASNFYSKQKKALFQRKKACFQVPSKHTFLFLFLCYLYEANKRTNPTEKGTLQQFFTK